jgi:hypothetical protein
MRRILIATLPLAVAAAVFATPAQAGNHSRGHPPRIAGTVFNTTCPGACAQSPGSPPVYQGTDLIVRVTRVSNGALVATLMASDGRFRVRVRRGLYSVSAEVKAPAPPPCGPQPVASADRIVCPLAAGPAIVPADCWQGETKQVAVRRHRVARVDLHVQNTCVAQPA